MHKSVISALVVSGAKLVYPPPELDAQNSVAHGDTPPTLAAALDDHPEAKAVLIVSPTYYGACSGGVELHHLAGRDRSSVDCSEVVGKCPPKQGTNKKSEPCVHISRVRHLR